MTLRNMREAKPIEKVAALSVEDFRARYFRRREPVVIEGLTADWASSEFWSFASLGRRYGSSLVVAAALRDNTLKEDPQQGVLFERIPLGEFVRCSDVGAARHYVMAPLWDLPEEFQSHLRIPVYCRGARYLRAKLWLGRAHTVTPLHWDVPHNLHVHLAGRKRWILFPPQARAALYPRGFLSGMPNFSQVDPENPDFSRFPRFQAAQPYVALVEPGQTLFIPRGWWHHTRLLEDAVSVNFWWGGLAVALAARASSGFKRLRGIRRNEWA